MIRSIGNSGARSSGPTGWPVPGCRTGGGGTGRSGTMLYQRVGISSSDNVIRWRLISLISSALGRSTPRATTLWFRAHHHQRNPSARLNGIAEPHQAGGDRDHPDSEEDLV